MFLLDSLLMAPGKAVLFLFEEMAKKAQEEFLDDETVKQELQEIYAMLEAGKISEQDFETREFRLVERLQQIALAKLQDMSSTGAPPAIDVVATEVTEPSVPALELGPTNDGWQVGPADERRELAPTEDRRAPALTFAPAIEIAAAAPVMAQPTFEPPPEPIVHADTPAPAAPAPPPAPVTPPGLTMPQVVESATRGLAMLKLKVSSVTSVARSESGWRVTVELLERRGVPDTSDLLGVYELLLDHGGNILQYERTRMRRRCDLSR
jgi:hypothetical protein